MLDQEAYICPDCVLANSDYQILVSHLLEEGVRVDCILSDPPYGISRKHQLGFSNMNRFGMDYGEWDYGVDCRRWIVECLPLLKDGGSIIIFNDWKNLSYLVEVLQECSCRIKDLIRWEKNNPMPRNVNARYVSDCEFALWAVKGKAKWTFNKPLDVPYLRTVFKGSVVLGKNRIHPTQKSLAVIEGLVKTHTHEREIVFDPFSGSGTTALACLKNNRRFIGSEIDSKYHTASIERIRSFMKGIEF